MRRRRVKAIVASSLAVLAQERRYVQQFERYVSHVSHWVKKEKI